MTNQDIWAIALRQSAYDCNCAPEDFLREQNVITLSKAHPKARKDIPLPLACDLVSYGSNVVAQTSPELQEAVETYLRRYPVEHCFETPNLQPWMRCCSPMGLRPASWRNISCRILPSLSRWIAAIP